MDKLMDVVKGVGGQLLAGALPASKALVSLLANTFGVVGKDPDIIALAIEKDPDAAAKIMEIQSNTRIEIARIGMQREAIDAGDRADARSREKALAQVTGNRDFLQYLMAYFVLIIFAYMVLATWGWGLPDVDGITLGALISGVIAAVMSVLNYYFGSSKAGNSNDSQDGKE